LLAPALFFGCASNLLRLVLGKQIQVIDIHDSGLRAPRTINAVEGSAVASKMGGVPDNF
jgi:hypothetical protein